VVNPKELLEVKKRIEENLDSEEYQILIKPHQHVYKCLKDKKEYQGLLVPSLVDSNELMSIVDVLISDFSSIFIDYMVLDRPILFYITDLEEYEKTRGLKVSPKELPGPYSDKPEEIAEYIKNLETIRIQYADPYREMKSRLCLYEDGKVSERIVNLVFGKSQEI
jgi:CDP-glycerol glycerophosphotransferase (TagB/SpsB family)